MLLCECGAILSLVSGINWRFLFTYSMPPLLALYAKQFLEIKLFTFDYHENKSQRTIDSVLMFY